MNVDTGEIRVLADGENTGPREIELTEEEHKTLNQLPPWQRLGVFASKKVQRLRQGKKFHASRKKR